MEMSSTLSGSDRTLRYIACMLSVQNSLHGLLPEPFLLNYSVLGRFFTVNVIMLVSNVRPSVHKTLLRFQ